MSVLHLAEAALCTRSKNRNKVGNLGSIFGGLRGHQPKKERFADMSALHKRRFADQQKMEEIRAEGC